MRSPRSRHTSSASARSSARSSACSSARSSACSSASSSAHSSACSSASSSAHSSARSSACSSARSSVYSSARSSACISVTLTPSTLTPSTLTLSALTLPACILLTLLLSLSQTSLAEGKDTRRGWDYAGFPLLNFTTDRGVGYGAYLASFNHGPEGAGDYPYLASIGGQFYQTTGGYAFHKLLLDFPNIANTGIRVDVSSGYETWDSAWYFGLGNQTPRLHPDETPDQYYEFDLRNIWVVPNLRVPITGGWSAFSGLIIRSADVGIYQGTLLDGDRPTGSAGGLLNLVQLGLLYDSRDREPSTRRGIFSEISLRGAHRVTGSDFSVWGANATHRQWFPLTRDERLILALRIGLDVHGGEVPFFHQHILGGSQWVELGGNLTLRGLPNGRLRGDVTAYSNLELRWQVADFTLGGQQLNTLLVPFFDLGRVWLRGERDDALHLHGSVGAGLRLAYNDVFVVRFDLAYALEEYTTMIGQRSVDERNGVIGFYAIVNHPF